MPTCAFGGRSLRRQRSTTVRPRHSSRLELDLDVALDRRDEPRADDVRHGDGIVDRRAVPAVGVAVVDREEVDEVGHERARRRPAP